MRTLSMSRIPNEKLTQLIAKLEFFNHLKTLDKKQFECVLDYCQIAIADSNEVICRKGDFDSVLYFLLKGRLQVYLQEPEAHVRPVSSVYPGEMFGTLAFVRDSERNATIKVDNSGEHAVLLSVDFSPFGDLDDFSIINQKTKQFLYHSIAIDTRRHLMRFRHAFPGDPYVNQFAAIEKIELKSADDDTDHLQKIYNESASLAQLLNDWNARAVSFEHELPKKSSSHDLVENIESLFFDRDRKAV